MPEPEEKERYINSRNAVPEPQPLTNGQPPKRQLPDAEEMAAGGCHR